MDISDAQQFSAYFLKAARVNPRFNQQCKAVEHLSRSVLDADRVTPGLEREIDSSIQTAKNILNAGLPHNKTIQETIKHSSSQRLVWPQRELQNQNPQAVRHAMQRVSGPVLVGYMSAPKAHIQMSGSGYGNPSNWKGHEDIGQLQFAPIAYASSSEETLASSMFRSEDYNNPGINSDTILSGMI